jgi:Polyketide cyclase / dehydrase and lipid transport
MFMKANGFLQNERDYIMTLMQAITWGGATVAVLLAGTYLLPRHVQVERSATISASAGQILALAASTEGYQSFNPYKTKDANLKIKPFGPASGVGAGFEFESKDGKGTSVVTAVTDSTVEYQIDLGSMGKPKQVLKVTPTGAGSTVTWTMHSDMGMNPIGRVVGLFLDGMLGKTFETGLANLANLKFS